MNPNALAHSLIVSWNFHFFRSEFIFRIAFLPSKGRQILLQNIRSIGNVCVFIVLFIFIHQLFLLDIIATDQLPWHLIFLISAERLVLTVIATTTIFSQNSKTFFNNAPKKRDNKWLKTVCLSGQFISLVVIFSTPPTERTNPNLNVITLLYAKLASKFPFLVCFKNHWSTHRAAIGGHHRKQPTADCRRRRRSLLLRSFIKNSPPFMPPFARARRLLPPSAVAKSVTVPIQFIHYYHY